MILPIQPASNSLYPGKDLSCVFFFADGSIEVDDSKKQLNNKQIRSKIPYLKKKPSYQRQEGVFMKAESPIKKTHLGIYGIFEKNHRILLVKKSRGPYKSTWDLPGGRQEHGESIFQTLQREVFEETGVVLSKMAPYKNASFLVEYKESETLISLHHTCLIYHALEFDDSATKKNIVAEDVSGCSWIEKSNLSQLPLSRVVLCI